MIIQQVLDYRDEGVQKFFPVIKIPIIKEKLCIMSTIGAQNDQNFPVLQGMYS